MSYTVRGALEFAFDEVEAEIERLVFERGMHMGHFDVMLGHVVGSLRDMNVPEVWTFNSDSMPICNWQAA